MNGGVGVSNGGSGGGGSSSTIVRSGMVNITRSSSNAPSSLPPLLLPPPPPPPPLPTHPHPVAITMVAPVTASIKHVTSHKSDPVDMDEVQDSRTAMSAMEKSNEQMVKRRNGNDNDIADGDGTSRRQTRKAAMLPYSSKQRFKGDNVAGADTVSDNSDEDSIEVMNDQHESRHHQHQHHQHHQQQQHPSTNSRTVRQTSAASNSSKENARLLSSHSPVDEIQRHMSQYGSNSRYVRMINKTHDAAYDRFTAIQKYHEASIWILAITWTILMGIGICTYSAWNIISQFQNTSSVLLIWYANLIVHLIRFHKDTHLFGGVWAHVVLIFCVIAVVYTQLQYQGCASMTDQQLQLAQSCYAHAYPSTALATCVSPADGAPLTYVTGTAVCPSVVYGRSLGDAYMMVQLVALYLYITLTVVYIVTWYVSRRFAPTYHHINKALQRSSDHDAIHAQAASHIGATMMSEFGIHLTSEEQRNLAKMHEMVEHTSPMTWNKSHVTALHNFVGKLHAQMQQIAPIRNAIASATAGAVEVVQSSVRTPSSSSSSLRQQQQRARIPL